MSNIDDFYKNITIIQSSIAEQTFARFQNQLAQMRNPIFDRTLNMQNQYDAIAAMAASAMAEKISSSFLLPISEILANQNYEKQILAMQNGLISLASSIASINVQPTYVSVPESLIPEDFLYEEVSDDSADTPDKTGEATVAVKRLSFDKALEFLKAVITVMQAIKLFTELSPPAIQVANKAIEYLISIYQAIEDRLS
ncbi:hypothetical protein AALB39_26905 [Lachnospiraceae bacterium 54-53]